VCHNAIWSLRPSHILKESDRALFHAESSNYADRRSSPPVPA